MSELLKFSKVYKYYRKKGLFRDDFVKVLYDIEFLIKRGSVTSVVGESGSGKTTIALLASFLEEPSYGKVIYKNKIIDINTDKDILWKEIQLVFQDPGKSLNPVKKIDCLLKEPLINYKICSKKEMEKKIDFFMEIFDISKDFLEKKSNELSGGEKQRIAIARALSVSPSLLILDEPFSSVDSLTQAKILSSLLDLKNKYGTTWIFISHDIRGLSSFSDYIIILYKGFIMEMGGIEILERPFHPYTRFLLFPEIRERIETNFKGCPFLPKCSFKGKLCWEKVPVLKFIDRRYMRCHLY
ncbi:MAG: ATP-binding cassette domain-containing protein [Candidatus Aminicenantia bacterium]